VDAKVAPNLFVWTDTCNVYVLREGDAALLIDLGDGSVLDHLGDAGVKRVEGVLFTHHHREQCQGAPRLLGRGAQVAAPEAERALFERPLDFRKLNVSLGDAFTIHGCSYVRPPIQPVPLNRTLQTNDTFAWRGHEFICLDTRGNSPGGMTYLLRRGDRTLAFSGDLILDGARMHTWFDAEWDYGFAAGIKALRESILRLSARQPDLLLPSQGTVIRNPQKQLRRYADKLERLQKLYVRGYDPEGGSVAYRDKVSTPTVVSNVFQVSPHLFKFKRPNFWPNFGLILADSGRALVVDCGLLDEKFLDTALAGMREQFGLKAIDAVIITHMHGDHFLEVPHLREKWGAPIWALDNMVDKMEHPERFDYAAPIQAYGK
jgi:glyoxylase-like metal-dependent hydrolase (beta-lactamase superfamily II)